MYVVRAITDHFVFEGIIHLLFPHLTFISSLAVAACLTPTDPIICAAIVGERIFFFAPSRPTLLLTVLLPIRWEICRPKCTDQHPPYLVC